MTLMIFPDAEHLPAGRQVGVSRVIPDLIGDPVWIPVFTGMTNCVKEREFLCYTFHVTRFALCVILFP